MVVDSGVCVVVSQYAIVAHVNTHNLHPNRSPLEYFYEVSVDMLLQYSLVWNTESKGLRPEGSLYAASFDVNGQRLACCDGRCIYILSAIPATLGVRIYYPKKATGLLWIEDILVCAFEDGTITSVSISEAKVSRAIFVLCMGMLADDNEANC